MKYTHLLNRLKEPQLRELLGPLLAFLCITYFMYHSIQGERGIRSMFHLKQRLEVAKSELNALTGQKESLERRVHLLRPDSLDLDLLEERARAVLNFARRDEVIIYEEPAHQK